jgi:hypothetical protein
LPREEITEGLNLLITFVTDPNFKGDAIRMEFPEIESGTWKFRSPRAEENFLEHTSRICYNYTNLGLITKQEVVRHLKEVARRHVRAGTIIRA